MNASGTAGDGIEWPWRAEAEASEFYDSLFRAVLRQVPRNSLILEIGVGNGYLLTRLTQHTGSKCVGVDVLNTAIEASRGTARAGASDCTW